MKTSKSLSGIFLASFLCVTTVTAFSLAKSSFDMQHKSKCLVHSLSMVLRRRNKRGIGRTIDAAPPMNYDIKYDKLRVTMPAREGNKKDEQLGIMSKSDALAKAKEFGNLDLILIHGNSDPPVAKIVDYSKFRYEQKRKEKKLQKNSKSIETKEMRMSYNIDVHDYGVRIKNASKVLSQGNRVKFTVQFKGRELQHDTFGFSLLNRMAEDMTKICIMKSRPKLEGRNLSCILHPRPGVTKVENVKKQTKTSPKEED